MSIDKFFGMQSLGVSRLTWVRSLLHQGLYGDSPHWLVNLVEALYVAERIQHRHIVLTR